MSIRVVDPGVLTLVEDLGRPGHQSIGVSPSGALDRGAHRMANRLVGNPEAAAGLELLAGGARLRFAGPTWFAVTGAWGDVSLAGGSTDGPVLMEAATLAPAGAELRFGRPSVGLRYTLAVRGGIAVAPTLGSRSTDTLSGLGPAPLLAGDDLPVGTETAGPVPSIENVPLPPDVLEPVELRLHPGPRDDWFDGASLRAVFGGRWTVSSASDRVGMRLLAGAGAAPLVRVRSGELASEAMVAGAVQVPASGLPVILLADHPATGGYPVVATVADASLDRLAQLRGGTELVFRHAPPLSV